MNFALSATRYGDTPVLAVSGEIGAESADTLTSGLTDLIQPGVSRLAVDLTGTTFMDSSGLGVLIDANNRADDCGVDLVLICPDNHRTIHHLLEITGLGKVLKVRPALEDE